MFRYYDLPYFIGFGTGNFKTPTGLSVHRRFGQPFNCLRLSLYSYWNEVRYI